MNCLQIIKSFIKSNTENQLISCQIERLYNRNPYHWYLHRCQNHEIQTVTSAGLSPEE